jgi:hypothetical protein
MRDLAPTSIFRYGTLESETVWRKVTGRMNECVPARLTGYVRYRVPKALYLPAFANPASELPTGND